MPPRRWSRRCRCVRRCARPWRRCNLVTAAAAAAGSRCWQESVAVNSARAAPAVKAAAARGRSAAAQTQKVPDAFTAAALPLAQPHSPPHGSGSGGGASRGKLAQEPTPKAPPPRTGLAPLSATELDVLIAHYTTITPPPGFSKPRDSRVHDASCLRLASAPCSLHICIAGSEEPPPPPLPLPLQQQLQHEAHSGCGFGIIEPACLQVGLSPAPCPLRDNSFQPRSRYSSCMAATSPSAHMAPCRVGACHCIACRSLARAWPVRQTPDRALANLKNPFSRAGVRGRGAPACRPGRHGGPFRLLHGRAQSLPRPRRRIKGICRLQISAAVVLLHRQHGDAPATPLRQCRLQTNGRAQTGA